MTELLLWIWILGTPIAWVVSVWSMWNEEHRSDHPEPGYAISMAIIQLPLATLWPLIALLLAAWAAFDKRTKAKAND